MKKVLFIVFLAFAVQASAQIASKSDNNIEILKSFDGSKIQPGISNYIMKIDTRGQKFEINISREILKKNFEGKNVFMAIDVASGMMGGNDTLLVDAETLLPIKRIISQGMMKVNLDFSPDSIKGIVDAGQNKMPVKIKTDTPAITEGANVQLAINSLPLSERYRVSFKQLDIMKSNITPMIIIVLGKEKLVLSSGDFESYKLEVKPEGSENETVNMWFDASTNKLLKTESKLDAAMGGGTVIVELTK